MAAVNPPSYLAGGEHSAISDRLTSAAFMQQSTAGTPMGVRGGVRPSAGGDALRVAASGTPDNHVVVNSGTVFVPGTAGGDVYVCHNDAPYTLTVAAASTTQSRRDLVVAKVYDPAADGSDPDNTWIPLIVTGTPSSGTPVAPAIPARAVPLAEILIPAGASTVVTTGNITDRRTSPTVALGGVIPCQSISDRPSSPYIGMTCYLANEDELHIWQGFGWSVQPMSPLPDQVFIASNALYNLGLIGSLTDLSPSVDGNISFARPALCTVHFSGILKLQGVAYAELFVQLRATGATIWQGSDHTAFGGTMGLYAANNGVRVDSHCHVTFDAVFNAGTTNVKVQHYSIGNAGLRQLQSPAVQITPLRYL